MKRRLLMTPGIVLPVLLAFACASAGITDLSLPTDWPEKEILARQMPEVSIRTYEKTYEPVKIIRLSGRELTILPYPYWNVDALKIDPEQILSIKFIRKKHFTPISAISVFNIAFGICGIFGAIFSKYEGEYLDALNGALGISSIFGICSLAIGMLQYAASHKNWELKGLATAERLEILLKIMRG